jgi:anti-anti-sigma factor
LAIASFSSSFPHECIAVLGVDGEIDISNVGRFHGECMNLAKNAPALVVDLTYCNYFDSTGLSELYALAKVEILHGLVVSSGSGLRSIFEIAAMDQIVPVFETIDQAVAAAGNVAARASSR